MDTRKAIFKHWSAKMNLTYYEHYQTATFYPNVSNFQQQKKFLTTRKELQRTRAELERMQVISSTRFVSCFPPDLKTKYASFFGVLK